jgi:hypothetical protein
VIEISGKAVVAGETILFRGGAREYSLWERYAATHGLPTRNIETGTVAVPFTEAAFLAYSCVTRGQAERPGFDAWLELLEDLESFDAADAPPTPAGVSDGPSPLSPAGPESLRNRSGMPNPATLQRSSTF